MLLVQRPGRRTSPVVAVSHQAATSPSDPSDKPSRSSRDEREVRHIFHDDRPGSNHGPAADDDRCHTDAVRAEGLKVIAKCPFIAAYMKKHPEYDNLKA